MAGRTEILIGAFLGMRRDRGRRHAGGREMKRDCIGLTPRRQGPAAEREGNLLISPTLCPTFRTISRSRCLSPCSLVLSSCSTFCLPAAQPLSLSCPAVFSPLFRYTQCPENLPNRFSRGRYQFRSFMENSIPPEISCYSFQNTHRYTF